MPTKIYVSGNYFVVESSVTGRKDRNSKSRTEYRVVGNKYYFFDRNKQEPVGAEAGYLLADLQDELGVPFPDEPTLVAFLDSNTGFNAASGGSGAVSSVFGRTGDVIAQAGDYLSSLITNDSSVSGATVSDALDNLESNLGEANTTSNEGVGFPLALPKDGVNLPFKTLLQGSNITLTNGGDEVTISASVQTTAGLLSFFHFTGDELTLPAGTFYFADDESKGTVASVSQTVVNNDNQKSYFAQDIISDNAPVDTPIPSGRYAAQIITEVSANGGEQRWTLEAYVTDIDGNPIASGITGAPIGDLGVQVLAILDSGIVDNLANNETAVTCSGFLTEDFVIPQNNRVRYHVSAEKVGTAGGAETFTVYYGSDYESFVEVPVTTTSDGVVNTSGVSGATVTDALNALNTGGGGLSNPAISSIDIANSDGTFTSANQVYIVRKLVPFDCTINELCTVISATGSGILTLGIYDDALNLLGQVDVGTAAGIQTGSIVPVNLTGGTYVWLAIKNSNGSVTLFKTTPFSDDDIVREQFFGGAGLPNPFAGFLGTQAPYVCAVG